MWLYSGKVALGSSTRLQQMGGGAGDGKDGRGEGLQLDPVLLPPTEHIGLLHPAPGGVGSRVLGKGRRLLATSVPCPVDVLLPVGICSQPAVLAVLQGVSQGPQQAVHVVLGRVVTHEADPQHLEEKGRLPLQHPPSGLVCGAHNELYGHTCEHPSLFLFSPHFFSVTIKICYPTN